MQILLTSAATKELLLYYQNSNVYWTFELLILLTIVGGQTRRQAGAMLWQAQEKLGLAKPALPRISKKLWSSYISKDIEVIFHKQINWGFLQFANILMLSSICQQIEVVFPLN